MGRPQDSSQERIPPRKSKPLNANLSSLTIGSLSLTPQFSEDVTSYAVSTSNATNTVTATPEDEDATVTITLGENTPVTNGSAVTWETGQNTLTIVVTNGSGDDAVTKTYTVNVTKS